jgi:hypothetical protein
MIDCDRNLCIWPFEFVGETCAMMAIISMIVIFSPVVLYAKNNRFIVAD